MWNKNDAKSSSLSPSIAPSPVPTPAPVPSESRREPAAIGSTITIKGELTGDEDLVIAGRLEGKVNLAKHSVTISKTGRVKADIRAKSIRVAGQVDGNLLGDDEVVIQQSGRVQGNIKASRVTLESGSKFKGSIDMELGPDAGTRDSEKSALTSTEDATIRATTSSSIPEPVRAPSFTS